MARIDWISGHGGLPRQSIMNLQDPKMDFAHPYAPSPDGIFMPFTPATGLKNLCDGRLPADINTDAPEEYPSIYAKGLHYNGSSGATPDHTRIDTHTPITQIATYYCRYKNLGVSASKSFWIGNTGGGSDFYWEGGQDNADLDLILAGNNYEVGENVTLHADGQWHHLWLLWDTINDVVEIYVDGIAKRGNPQNTLPAIPATNYRLGSNRDDNRYSPLGVTEILAIWPNRYFSHAECNYVQSIIYDLVKP